METVKDFFQSVYDSYRDRVKSPFIGSFMISFIIFNWRAFAILFYSEWSMHCRIEWVEQQYCNLMNLFYPIGISLFYVLILPYINLCIEFVLKYYSDKKQMKIDEQETARLLKRKANAKILRQIADEKAGTSEINNLQTRIESLQQEIADLTEQNKVDTQRWNERATTSLEKEKELNDIVKNVTNQNKNLSHQLTTLKNYQDEEAFKRLQSPDLNEKLSETVSQLSIKDAASLMSFYNNGNERISMHFENGSNKGIFKRLEILGIIKVTDNWADLTTFGKQVLSWVENDYLDR